MGGQQNGSRADLTVQDLVGMAGVVEALQTVDAEVERQFNLAAEKENARTRLAAARAAMGEHDDPAHISAAVDQLYADLYRFQKPKPSTDLRLANAYVNRRNILMRRVLPVAAIAMLVVGGKFLYDGVAAAARHARERGVEVAIEGAYADRTLLHNKIDTLAASPIRAELPAAQNAELETLLSGAVAQIDSLAFFAEYAPNGHVVEAITPENFTAAQERLSGIAALLGTVRTDLDRADGIIVTHQKLASTYQALESIITAIRTSDAPKSFTDRAEQAYRNGVASYQSRELDGLQRARQELSGVQRDVKDFAALPSEVEQSYHAVSAIAKERAAVEQGNAFYREAQGYLQTGDLTNTRIAVGKLDTLATALGDEYSIIVTSGIWQYDNNNRSSRHFYLVVEAQDSQGRVLEREIQDEVTRRTSRVREWGIKVPEEVYDRVGADYGDDNEVDENLFARKRRGFLHEEVVMTHRGTPLDVKNTITKWDEPR